MEVHFTKEETIKMIEEYYKRLESRIVKADINARVGYTGWQDDQECVTSFTISEKIEIVGMEKEVKETIGKDLLHTILKALFDLYELELVSITVNDGLSSRWEGYGYNEHEIKTAYCTGITVNVNKKKNYGLAKKTQNN